MSIVLNSAGGGSVTINEPNTASNRTLTLPDNTGNLISTADSGTVTPTMLSQKLTLETAKASTSGTAVDFTGIPSWVKRITIMIDGVSFNGSAAFRIQLGDSGGIETSGYTGVASFAGQSNTAGAAAFSSGFDSTADGSAAVVRYGAFYLTNLTGNTWAITGIYGCPGSSIFTMQFAGTKTLSATLDRVRICSANGTDTFDAGTINILYEG